MDDQQNFLKIFKKLTSPKKIIKVNTRIVPIKIKITLMLFATILFGSIVLSGSSSGGSIYTKKDLPLNPVYVKKYPPRGFGVVLFLQNFSSTLAIVPGAQAEQAVLLGLKD